MFYVAIIIYTFATFIPFRHHLLLTFVSLSCGFSLYLLTCLLRLGDLCLVCIATYFVNFVMLWFAVKQVKAAATTKASKAAKKTN